MPREDLCQASTDLIAAVCLITVSITSIYLSSLPNLITQHTINHNINNVIQYMQANLDLMLRLLFEVLLYLPTSSMLPITTLTVYSYCLLRRDWRQEGWPDKFFIQIINGVARWKWLELYPHFIFFLMFYLYIYNNFRSGVEWFEEDLMLWDTRWYD